MNIDENNIEKIMKEIIEIFLKNPPSEALNGLMSAFSHIIYHGYKDKKARKVVVNKIRDSMLENMDILEKNGYLKENYEDGVVRKKFVF